MRHAGLGGFVLLGAIPAFAAKGPDIDFESHDVNNDGYLSEIEWHKADFVTISFVEADTDNNGRIDREEAQAAADEGPEQRVPPRGGE